MFVSNEHYKIIKKTEELLHQTRKSDVNLCQYKGHSCVRCCIPHIGGDFPQGISNEEMASEFNKDNNLFHLKYGSRYIGPNGLKMRFSNFHPLRVPGFRASGMENSFGDEGKEHNEEKYSNRRNVFSKTFSRKNPKKSLTAYISKIQESEKYTYDPEKDKGAGLCSVFLGMDYHLKDGNLPECHLLGFLDDDKKKVGCLGHPKVTNTKKDQREQFGFFRNDSCSHAQCDWNEEFQYLSDDARAVFDKAIEGKSWYEYSRHSTAVLVAYLRSYDHIIQKLVENGKEFGLEELVEFTNNLYEDWPLRRPQWAASYPESGWRIPQIPREGVLLKQSELDFYIGDINNVPEKIHRLTEDADKYILEKKYSLLSTKNGYSFMFDDRTININIEKGNKPIFECNHEDLIRIGILSHIYYKTKLNDLYAGKNRIIQSLDSALSYKSDAWCGKSDMELLKNPGGYEGLMYIGLESLFLKEMFRDQLKQAREYIESSINNF